MVLVSLIVDVLALRVRLVVVDASQMTLGMGALPSRVSDQVPEPIVNTLVLEPVMLTLPVVTLKLLAVKVPWVKVKVPVSVKASFKVSVVPAVLLTVTL